MWGLVRTPQIIFLFFLLSLNNRVFCDQEKDALTSILESQGFNVVTLKPGEWSEVESELLNTFDSALFNTEFIPPLNDPECLAHFKVLNRAMKYNVEEKSCGKKWTAGESLEYILEHYKVAKSLGEMVGSNIVRLTEIMTRVHDFHKEIGAVINKNLGQKDSLAKVLREQTISNSYLKRWREAVQKFHSFSTEVNQQFYDANIDDDLLTNNKDYHQVRIKIKSLSEMSKHFYLQHLVCVQKQLKIEDEGFKNVLESPVKIDLEIFEELLALYREVDAGENQILILTPGNTEVETIQKHVQELKSSIIPNFLKTNKNELHKFAHASVSSSLSAMKNAGQLDMIASEVESVVGSVRRQKIKMTKFEEENLIDNGYARVMNKNEL